VKTKKKPHSRSLQIAAFLAEEANKLTRYGANDGFKSRIDADETVMLALQLEQMQNRVFEDEFAELKARAFLPVDNSVNTGAETFSYKETTEVGEAGKITNYADDFPSVEVSGVKRTHDIVARGVSYTYSIQDIRRAAFVGEPLESRKARAARRAFERAVDTIAAVGAPDEGIATGFLNNASVSITALAAVGAWSTKTPTQIVNDLNALFASVVTGSKELYTPNRLLMPLASYHVASQTRMAADTSETVLQAFLTANPQITDVQPWDKLATAGAGATGRLVAYRYDPDVVELVIPQEFEVMPPQAKNMAFVVNCHGRTAGCVIHRPLGVKYMDGV
jgi:hypothetical protein